MKKDFEIRDYDYIGSSIGYAYFSGVNFDELWNCVVMSESREQLDAAVDITIKLKEMNCVSRKDT